MSKEKKKATGKNPKSVAGKRARKISMDRKSELVIHGRDGRIQDKKRYDNNPPSSENDKKH